MANKLITALKEDKNDIRKKLAIVGGIVVTSVIAGIVITKLSGQTVWLVSETPVEAAIDIATETISES